MFKTTARYAEHQRTKATEQESKLKQVYIPNYNKPNQNLLPEAALTRYAQPCESCRAESAPSWFAWGPSSQQLRLCQSCWTKDWKKHGGLKKAHQLETYDLDGGGRANKGAAGRANGNPAKVSQHVYQTAKGRSAFYLHTNFHARVARK